MTTQAEANSAKGKNSVVGVLTFFLLIIAVSVMSFAVYLKTIGYEFENLNIREAVAYAREHIQKPLSEASADISFSQDGTTDCKVYKGNTILLSRDGIKWYDKTGKLLKEKALTLTRPVLRTSKKYMAIIDISGRDVFFFKDKTQLWTKKLGNQIINADVSEEGYCTIVTQSKEYKTEVLVFDVNGADVYKKFCAEDIVLGAKSLNEGEGVLINKVITKSIKAGTEFEFNSVYEEKPYATLSISENVFPVTIAVGKNVVAVGQNLAVFMDGQGKELWRKGAESIFCVAPDSNKYVILAGKFADSGGDIAQKVLILNTKGEEVYSFKQPESISGMSLYEDRLMLRTQRSIYLYSLKGEKLGHYIARNEIKDAYMVGSNKTILITGGNISLVEIK